MRIYLATWLEDNQSVSLTKVKAMCRLMSFFFLRDFSAFKQYITDGLIPKKEIK